MHHVAIDLAFLPSTATIYHYVSQKNGFEAHYGTKSLYSLSVPDFSILWARECTSISHNQCAPE